MDGVITHEFYDRKNKKFSDELITIQSKLKKLTDNNSVYYQLGLNYYDLAKKGKLIYNKARLDQKRQLIRIIFKELYLNEGKLVYKLKRAFEILGDIASIVNSSKVEKVVKKEESTFEPEEKIVMTSQMPVFLASCPPLLPRLDSNQ